MKTYSETDPVYVIRTMFTDMQTYPQLWRNYETAVAFGMLIATRAYMSY